MNNNKVFNTLDFIPVRQSVSHYAQTELGKANAMKLAPSQDIKQILTWQEETAAGLAILEQQRVIPIPRINRLDQIIKRLQLGGDLNGSELAQVGRLMSSVQQVVIFFEDLSENHKTYPSMEYWIKQFITLPSLVRIIEQTVSEDGSVLPTASEELTRIVRQQAQAEQQIRESLNQILRNKSAALSDNLITIRNNRYVVPVKADSRNQVPGTIHDQSSTGQTLFIEPQSVMNLNNRIGSLKVAEQREIERILHEVSGQLMPYASDIALNEVIIAQLDVIQARAEYAREMDAVQPTFSEEQHVALWQARHPLISTEDVVANDILIGETYRSLIITGPNTGGKTIILKTLGMMQLMGQSGLHIPCAKGSQLGIFDQIYADIGDEQSIEQSLSTFSSHMTNIVNILQQATHQSLLLFDELGSGTDPQEGAALAMSILDYTRKIGCIVMATTHYPELKLYANQAPYTLNASMEFNSDTLSPTYRLLIGVPGRSNAFEISERLGLLPEIIKQAREGMSVDDLSMNEMVANLERERREVEQNQQYAERLLDEAQQLHQDLRTEYNRWLDAKDQLRNQAIREANEMIQEKQKEADRLISEIRDLQLEQGQQMTIKEDVLIDKKSQLKSLTEAEKLTKNKVLKRVQRQKSIEVGDEVEVQSYGQRGTVTEKVSNKEYVVQMGVMKMRIEASDLTLIDKVKNKQQINVQRQAGTKVNTTLDIRGERYDAGVVKLNQYIDQALLSNHPMVTIIHGKGTGALRDGVRQALKRHPQVDRYESSPPNAGGDGATVVYFK